MGIKIDQLPSDVRAAIYGHNGRAHKFGVADAGKRTCDGVLFASRLEMLVYQALKEQLEPDEFTLQPRFELQPAFKLFGRKVQAIVYVGDFLLGPPRVLDDEPLQPGQVVLDAKGVRTDVYSLKSRLFKFTYQASIVEVQKSSTVVDVVRKWREGFYDK